MSKRRINNQQSARIEKKQNLYQEMTNNKISGPTCEGLVITCFGSKAIIETSTKERIRCSIRPNIDFLVAGDRVIWQPEGDGHGVIISQIPRTSVLGRPNKHNQIKPVAANLTQLIIVVAPKPEISWVLLDSYLVMAEYFNLKAAIVLNKTDLPCDDIKKQLTLEYTSLGYPILFINNTDKKNHKNLEDIVNLETSVFVGQSGVGKSSLISSILPLETNIQTQSISSRTNLGKHTTSNSTFYHIPTGGAIIDSPGVREFGLWHMPITEIAKCYRDFKPYLAQCKFRNCNHLNNFGCAIIAATHENLISHNRYENYVKISAQFAI